MSFFTKGDFKTRQQWLKKEKKAALKKQEQKYNKSNKIAQSKPPDAHRNEKLSQIIIFDTQKSTPLPNSQICINLFKKESDAELYSLMRAELQRQEHLRAQQYSQISELNRLIQQAKTQGTILKAVNSAIPSFESAKSIERLNKELRSKFEEMQAYLNCHGAFFEGPSIVGELNLIKIKKDILQSKTNYNTPSSYQFTAIQQRVHQLNENLLKEIGSKRIVKAHGVYQFKQNNEIQLVFYRNGMYFQGYQFIQYSSKKGAKILQDLKDGYYPHILKSSFPQGIYLNIKSNCINFWQGCENSQQNDNWFKGCYEIFDCPPHNPVYNIII